MQPSGGEQSVQAIRRLEVGHGHQHQDGDRQRFVGYLRGLLKRVDRQEVRTGPSQSHGQLSSPQTVPIRLEDRTQHTVRTDHRAEHPHVVVDSTKIDVDQAGWGHNSIRWASGSNSCIVNRASLPSPADGGDSFHCFVRVGRLQRRAATVAGL